MVQSSPRVVRCLLLLTRIAAALSVYFLLPHRPTARAQEAPPPRLLVANQGDRTLGVLDADLALNTGTLPESDITGHEVAALPDGQTAFVPIYGNSGVGRPGTDGRVIDVFNVRAGRLSRQIRFDHGVRPHCAVYDPHRGLLYVTTELDHSVTVIDPRTLRIVGAVPTGQPESHMLALSSNGALGYTANVGPGTVSVLDLNHRRTLAIVPVAHTVQRISISPDDRYVFTSDQQTPRLAVIDTRSNTVARWVPLPAVGYGSAAAGHWLLVALPAANQVAVVDLRTFTLARTIAVGRHPSEILVPPGGRTAYIACMESGDIAVIDLASWKTQKSLPAGRGADGLAWLP